MPVRISLIVAMALLAGAGCGRRGDLEDPGAEMREPAPGTPSSLDGASPGAQEPPAVQPGNAAPQRRFLLDPLI